MQPISFKRHQFPADVILHAVWLYFRFSLSFRDVEELMAARGVDVSYETIRCWTIKFGPLIARRFKKRRWPPTALSGKLPSAEKSPYPSRFRQPQPPCGISISIGAEAAKCGSADQMALDVEHVVDRCVGGEKSLG